MTVVRTPVPNGARRRMVRAVLAAVYVLLGAAVFLSGRTHTIIIDYSVPDDGSVPAVDMVTVHIGRNEGIEYMGGAFRDKVTVAGQRHTLVIEPFTGGDSVVREFMLPVAVDLFLLSIPKAAAGLEPFIGPYIAPATIVSEGGGFGGNSFTSPGNADASSLESGSDKASATSAAP